MLTISACTSRIALLCVACATVACLLQTTHAQFDTVINSPPTFIGNMEEIGSDTQLNLFDGGSVRRLFSAGVFLEENENIEVNVFGGVVGDRFRAQNGSKVNIHDGTIGNGFLAHSGSEVNITGAAFRDLELRKGSEVSIAGGSFGRIDGGGILNVSGGNLGRITISGEDGQVQLSGGSSRRLVVEDANNAGISGGTVSSVLARNSQLEITGGSLGSLHSDADSNTTIRGGDFRLGDILIDGLENVGSEVVTSEDDQLLSGTLADGTPFYFSDPGSLTLVVFDLPPIGPSVITASTDPFPHGIRTGQTLIVDGGAIVPDAFQAGWGSSLSVLPSGVVGDNATVAGGTVDVSGGSIGDGLRAYSSIVTVSSGSLGSEFLADAGSQVNVLGGTIASGLVVGSESELNLLGGRVGRLSAESGSRTTITGGLHGVVRAEQQSEVIVVGGDFRLDGNPIAGLVSDGDQFVFDLPDRAALSGVLSDGTPFFYFSERSLLGGFTYVSFDSFPDGALVLEKSDVPPIDPALITASVDPIPSGLREGQSLVVDNGGFVGNYFTASWDSTVEIQEGGTVDAFEAVGADVIVSGGTAAAIYPFFGSHVDVNAGSVGTIESQVGSRVTISGGSVAHLEVADGSQANISGGSIGDDSSARGNVSISGGVIGNGFRVKGFCVSGDCQGGHVTISDGTIGYGIHVESGARAIITGGAVGSWMSVAGTMVQTGGSIGGQFEIHEDGRAKIAGGSMEDMTARIGAEAVIIGGSIGGIAAFEESQLFIAGGTLQEILRAHEQSEVNLYGSQFSLNGADLAGTTPGISTTIDTRDTVLSGELADGTQFSIQLSTRDPFTDKLRFSTDAILTATLVSMLQGDYNSDGTVEQSDLDQVLLNWGEELFNPFAAGWINDIPNGRVDQDELDRILLNWGNGVTAAAPSHAAVPEPASFLLLLIAAMCAFAGISRTKHRIGRNRA